MYLKKVSKKIVWLLATAMLFTICPLSNAYAADSSQGQVLKSDVIPSNPEVYIKGTEIFNGSNEGLSIGKSLPGKLTGDFTIEMDINPGTSQQTYADIIDFNHRTNIGLVIQQNQDDTNNFGFYIANGSASAGIQYRLQPSVWQHVEFQRNGSVIKLYVNGVLVDAQPCFTGSIYYLPNSNVTIGYNVNYGRYFNGYIKEIKIWSYAKTNH